MKKILNLLILFLFGNLNLMAESRIAYNTISEIFKGLTSKNDNPEIVAYLKFKKNEKLAPNGQFRIERNDGQKILLVTQLLNSIDVDSLSIQDKDYMKKGYTRKIYIPIDEKKYKNSELVHDLEKGSFDLILKVQVEVKDLHMSLSD